jgi:aspartate 1-decarboxylase
MLLRRFLRAQIRGATVTAGDPQQADSLAVDASIMEAADLDQLEQVVLCSGTGWEWTTSLEAAERESGVVELRGPGARRLRHAQEATISAWATVDRTELATVRARLVEVDRRNRVVEIRQLRIADEP